MKRLTGAAIAALTAPQKPAGLVVYNTTTVKLQISDGSAFADIETAPTWTSDWTPSPGDAGSAVSKTQGLRVHQIGDRNRVRGSVTPQATKVPPGNYEFACRSTCRQPSAPACSGASIPAPRTMADSRQDRPVGDAKFLVSGYGSERHPPVTDRVR